MENLKKQLPGTNINSSTYLATDYLNHFNEAIMMLEMLPMMPDFLDDFLNWRPSDYRDYFKNSSFPFKELAIEAFEYVDPMRKRLLIFHVNEVNYILYKSQQNLQSLQNTEELETKLANMQLAIEEYKNKILKQLDLLNTLVNSEEMNFGTTFQDPRETYHHDDKQHEIDALFK